jgi:mono/diheme cytochrome c family protein
MALPVAGCSASKTPDVVAVNKGVQGVMTAHGSNRPKPLSTREALEFIDKNCFECHGPGKPLAAAFSIPAKDVLLKDASWLDGSALNQTAYQSIVNKYLKKVDSPSAMPPEFKDPEQEKKLANLIAWFQDTLPGAVREAEIKFGIKPEFRSNIQVQLDAKCEKLISGWDFQNRFMTRALGSPVNPEDPLQKALLTEAEKTAPASAEARKKVVQGLLALPEMKKKFEDVAVFSLAQKIANAGAIRKNGLTVQPALSPEAVKDLQSEFPQLVKKYYETVPYPQLFLLDKVMVTRATAPLYNSNDADLRNLPVAHREKYQESCSAPVQGEKWAECTLSPKRGNFFGTRGFLVSKSVAMFQNNNNYGRGGDAHQVIFGEVLMANTDGVSGEKPKPIPQCLDVTADKRWVLKTKGDLNAGKAAWGAIAIPFYGRVCQGCHLNRHLAAASVIFRPFGFAGEVIFPEMMVSNNGNPIKLYDDMDLVQRKKPDNATGPEVRTHVTHTDSEGKSFKFIDPLFYRGLLEELDNNEKATCFPDPADPLNMSKAKYANSTAQYGEYLIHQNDPPDARVKGVATIRGLTRFLPSTFANTNSTNLEIIRDVNIAFSKSNGMLKPMLEAYFQTESFACTGR